MLLRCGTFCGARAKASKKTVHGTEQLRPDVARRRYWWRKYQNRIDASRLVFIDETWTKTNMAPLRGWGEKGDRLQAFVPHGHWKTMTFLAALRSHGITAPCVFDGPINGPSFQRYVEQFLLPTLKRGDFVIMDNLGSHKGEAVRAAIKSVGARLLFLPPYSPDLNPIEQVFSKLKHLLRKAKARTVEATWSNIGLLLDTFQPDQCSNYFANAGYGSV
jgi:transposase